MRRGVKVAGAVLLAAALLSLSLFLPELTVCFSERGLLGEIRLEEADPLSLEELSTLSLVEKLKISKSILAVSTDLELGAERQALAEEKAYKALGEVMDGGVFLRFDKAFHGFDISSCKSFLALSEGSSFVVWRVEFVIWQDAGQKGGITGELWLDDETGTLLRLEIAPDLEDKYAAESAFSDVIGEYLERADWLANYLGLEILSMESIDENLLLKEKELSMEYRKGDESVVLTVGVWGFR